MKLSYETDKVKNEKTYNLFYYTKEQMSCYKSLSKKNILEQKGINIIKDPEKWTLIMKLTKYLLCLMIQMTYK